MFAFPYSSHRKNSILLLLAIGQKEKSLIGQKRLSRFLMRLIHGMEPKSIFIWLEWAISILLAWCAQSRENALPRS